MTSLAIVTSASEEVAAESARNAKTKRLAEVLRAADDGDMSTVVAWLSGDLVQRRVGVGWAALATSPAPAAETSLTVEEVNRAFAEMAAVSGAGS